MNQSNNEIESRLEMIFDLLKEIKSNQYDFLKNKILTFDQGCQYLGYAKIYVYKLTSAVILPYSKPNGKSIFFDRKKLEAWMLSNGKATRDEKLIEAATFVNG